MSLDERFGYLLLGILIGLVIGYLFGSLRSIEEKVKEVDDIVKKDRDEKGFVRYPMLANLTLFLVLIITAFAAFSSQKASNEVQETQRQMEATTDCTQEYLTKMIVAINERTERTGSQSISNVKLQKAQYKLLVEMMRIPPPSEIESGENLRKYVDALVEYLDISKDTVDARKDTPYPTQDEFENCLAKNEG